MADYVRLISRGVAELPSNKEDGRRALYDRMRAVLLGRLESLDPPLDAVSRTRERLALEEAFRRVEASVETAAELGVPFAEFDHHGRIVDALAGLADRLEQQPHGARIALAADGVVAFAATASAADREIAADPLIRHVYAQIGSRSVALDACAAQLSRRGRWAGLARAIDLIGTLLEQPAADAAARIGSLWSLTVSLRAYLEQSEDVRWKAGGTEDPLDAEVLRVVKDFVLAAGPWVRRFPTGRHLDSDVATWTGQEGDEAPAVALLGRVERAKLFGGDDAVIVAIALDAGRGKSVPAIRARSWANATIRNIAVVLVQAQVALSRTRIGAADANFRPDADHARAIAAVVMGSREELGALLASLGHQIDAEAVREALRQLGPAPAGG